MSNRTDFEVLAQELATEFNFKNVTDWWMRELVHRLKTELHNAFVAGQETLQAHECNKGGYSIGCPKCDILILKKQHSEQMDQLGFEIEELKAAVEIARKKGECHPFCRMPPREIMKLNDEGQRAWREERRAKYPDGRYPCDCWKAEMEAALK